MRHDEASKHGDGRTIVPSHHPLPGADEAPIEGGATAGAQLPPAPSADKRRPVNWDDREVDPKLNPNQADVLSPYAPEK
jgi:hypothetical protein